MLFHLHHRVSSAREETSQREHNRKSWHTVKKGTKKGQDRNKTDLKSYIYDAPGSAKYFLLLPRVFSAPADIQG